MAISRAIAGDTQDKSGALCSVRKFFKCLNTHTKSFDMGMSKGHRRQLKELPMVKAETI